MRFSLSLSVSLSFRLFSVSNLCLYLCVSHSLTWAQAFQAAELAPSSADLEKIRMLLDELTMYPHSVQLRPELIFGKTDLTTPPPPVTSSNVRDGQIH